MQVNSSTSRSYLPLKLQEWLNPEPNSIRAIKVLALVYFIGLLGILIPFHEQFILLTPVNLLFSLTLTLFFHTDWSPKAILFLGIAFFVGFGIEMIGVNTGLVFGSYEYGRVLGLQWHRTPFMIGVNWILVTYCSGIAINHIFPNWHLLLKSLLGALLLVSLDLLIEPVAMYYGFWSWENDVVPFQNYAAWFGIGFTLLVCFYALIGKSTNKVAFALLILQFAFFWLLGFGISN